MKIIERTEEYLELYYGLGPCKRDVSGAPSKPVIVHVPFKDELPIMKDHQDPLCPAGKGMGYGFPIVFVNYHIKGMKSKRLDIIWIEERKEWVAIQEFIDYASAESETNHYCKGPYSINKICIEKLLEAYKVSIPKMPPSKLETIVGIKSVCYLS